MPLGVSRDHLELSSSLHAWASGLDGPAAVREAETDTGAAFTKTWQAVVEMGLTGIGIAEEHGGGGGDLLDQMVALEAAAHGLVPGPLLGSTLVGQVVTDSDVLASIAAGVGAAVAVTDELAFDVVDARWLLARADDGSWVLHDSDGWNAEPVLRIWLMMTWSSWPCWARCITSAMPMRRCCAWASAMAAAWLISRRSGFVKGLAGSKWIVTRLPLTNAFHVPTIFPSMITLGPSAFHAGMRSLTSFRGL